MSEQPVFAYVFSEETTKEILSGNAYLGVGGAKRNNGTSLELGRPSIISRGVANTSSGTEIDISSQIRKLGQDNNQLLTSLSQLSEIKEATWLLYALSCQTYSITLEGFKETLCGLNQIQQYLKKKDLSDEYERINIYKLDLSSYAGKMRSQDFNVTNSSIDERLNEISIHLQKQANIFSSKSEISILAFQIISSIIEPFSYVVRKYSALFYCETGMLPANYDTWVGVVKNLYSSRAFQDYLLYHLRLDSGLSVQECINVGIALKEKAKELVYQIEFDTKYVESHSKDDYISMNDTIQKKIISGDYQITDRRMQIIL